MKYLKLFEDQDIVIPYESEIRDAIDNIFVELEDDGFIVGKKLSYSMDSAIHYFIEVKISRNDELFDTAIIRERTEMLIEYVTEIWGEVHIKFFIKDDKNGNLMDSMDDVPYDKAILFSVGITKINYKPTLIDKVNKFFKK